MKKRGWLKRVVRATAMLAAMISISGCSVVGSALMASAEEKAGRGKTGERDQMSELAALLKSAAEQIPEEEGAVQTEPWEGLIEITRDSVTVRSRPEADAEPVGTLAKGAWYGVYFRAVDETGAYWYEISFDGSPAYVRADEVRTAEGDSDVPAAQSDWGENGPLSVFACGEISSVLYNSYDANGLAPKHVLREGETLWVTGLEYLMEIDVYGYVLRSIPMGGQYHIKERLTNSAGEEFFVLCWGTVWRVIDAEGNDVTDQIFPGQEIRYAGNGYVVTAKMEETYKSAAAHVMFYDTSMRLLRDILGTLYRADEQPYIGTGFFKIVDSETGDCYLADMASDLLIKCNGYETYTDGTYFEQLHPAGEYFLFDRNGEGWTTSGYVYGEYRYAGVFNGCVIYGKTIISGDGEVLGYVAPEGVTVTDIRGFYDGQYALMTIVNSAGSHFVTIIDKDGNWMFDPVPGCSIVEEVFLFSQEERLFMYLDEGMFLCMDEKEGEYFILEKDGSVHYLDGMASFCKKKDLNEMVLLEYADGTRAVMVCGELIYF